MKIRILATLLMLVPGVSLAAVRGGDASADRPQLRPGSHRIVHLQRSDHGAPVYFLQGTQLPSRAG